MWLFPPEAITGCTRGLIFYNIVVNVLVFQGYIGYTNIQIFGVQVIIVIGSRRFLGYISYIDIGIFGVWVIIVIGVLGVSWIYVF